MGGIRNGSRFLYGSDFALYSLEDVFAAESIVTPLLKLGPV
jgi:hypothetical protein